MKKWKAYWYNATEVKYEDPEPIVAENEEEATKQAYMRFNGHPPAPVLYLEPIGG